MQQVGIGSKSKLDPFKIVGHIPDPRLRDEFDRSLLDIVTSEQSIERDRRMIYAA